MKKTKAFLAGLCLLVAGTGIAATKAELKTSFTYYFELTVGNPATCQTVVGSMDPGCDTTSLFACNVTIDNEIGTRQLFLRENPITGNCTTPLFRP
ncbi:hypothetical protein [Dinghuibacter silviterrae]|uniref:hypothetical protein n=1 Tax=Dinghuibacter silviterrae TaxID=1539049 RepID=UPI0013C3332A|nr:hypothetical protein [Dinghuibacter silviterrae]